MLTLMDISNLCSMIQRLNLYNLLIDKSDCKSLEQFIGETKKAKKVSESANELSRKENT